MLHVNAEYEVITLDRLKEVQAQAEAAKVKVAEADALDAAVQLMEDFQVYPRLCIPITCTLCQHISRACASLPGLCGMCPICAERMKHAKRRYPQTCLAPARPWKPDCLDARNLVMALCRSAAGH